MQKNTRVDFTGQEIYVGLDTGKIMSELLSEVQNFHLISVLEYDML